MVGVACITGIDGTGKTSHAVSVCRRLKSQGVGVEYAYGRLSPGILTKTLFLVGRSFSRRKKFSVGNAPADKLPSPARMIAVAGVATLMFIEYIPALRKRIFSAEKGTDLMVFDRYVFDTTVSDIGSVFGLNSTRVSQITKVFQAFVPKPAITILLDLPPSEAASRKPEESIGYLEFCRDRYTTLATENRWIKISSSESFETVDDVILATILNRLEDQTSRRGTK